MSGPSGTVVVQLLVVAALVLWFLPTSSPRLPAPPGVARGSEEGAGTRGAVAGLACRVSVALHIDTSDWIDTSGWSVRSVVRSVLGWVRSHPVWASVVLAGVVVVGPVALVGLAVVPLVGWWRGLRSAHRQAEALVVELPDVVDLMRLAVASGCTVHLAVEAVVHHGRGRIADRMATVLARVERGARLSDALAASRSQVEPLSPVLDALIAADRYGTPLVPVLQRLGDDARVARRARAEAAARRVPVQLLFPLVVCILPAIGFLTVIPVASSALEGMDLGF